MSGRLMVVAAVLALFFLAQSRPAFALWPLPWCFEMPPFSDTFILNAKPTGNNQRSGSGRDTVRDDHRVVSANAFVVDGVLQLGLMVFPIPGYFPIIVQAQVNPNTGIGSATCTIAINGAACGNPPAAVQSFTRIVCPGTVDSAAAAAAAATVRLSDVVEVGQAAGAIPVAD